MFKHSLPLALLCSALAYAPRGAAGADAPPGDPNWLRRGQMNVSNDEGHVFYALGRAPHVDGQSGESQRSAADAAAHAEMLKVITGFISAMQGYNTADAQNTMIAMQSLQGPLLHGVHIVDRQVQADGTVVSLCSFDLASVSAVIVRAKDRGLILGDVEPRGLYDMFDKNATKLAAASAVAGVHESSFGDGSIKADSSKIKLLGGNKPSWADGGASPRVPNTVYLCGTGKGGRRGTAEDAGFTVIANILKENVDGTLASLNAAAGKLGIPALKGTDDIAKAVTAPLLPQINTLEVWADPKGSTYVLVCIERVPATQDLRKVLAEDDKKIADALAAVLKGEGKDAQLAAASNALVHREAANALIRGVSLAQVGVVSPVTLVDLADAFKPGFTPVKVAVKADGPYWLGFANAMVSGMAGKGYQVGLVAVTPKPDILVSAVVTMDEDKAGVVAANGSASVDIKDVLQNKAIGSFKESDKASEKNRYDSERAVVRKLADKLSKQAAEKIGIKK